MNIIEAIFCGIVQGACEFLPISSSGHLALLHGVLGSLGDGDLYFDILLHLGTLAAVVIFYFRDICAVALAYIRLIKRIFKKEFDIKTLDSDEKTALILFFSSVPMVLAPLIKDEAEMISMYPRVIGAILLLNGVMLMLCGRIGRGKREISSLSPMGALGIGFFQLAAVMPGLSRSGSTITGGRVFGLSAEESVRLSFLMSIPAIIGANIFTVFDLSSSSACIDIVPCVCGAITAALVGMASIWMIKRISKVGNFNIFGIYCILIGAFFAIYGA